MHNQHAPSIVIVLIATLVVLITSVTAAAQKEQVIYSFSGSNPTGGVTFDAAGNLYGAQTLQIYKLTPQLNGSWIRSDMYNFNDSEDVEGTMAWDASGNLYGVTLGGPGDDGNVFQFVPSGTSWITNIPYTFPPSGAKGISPYGDLVLDSAGNIYGTTFYGGRYGDQSHGGVAWEVSPGTDGGWTFKRLHNFGNGMDGDGPYSGMVLDSAGNLYGTTVGGGSKGNGTVFELIPQANGTWTEKILHNFAAGFDGQGPRAKLTLDAAGNLYGTTVTGGRYGLGTAFELVKPSAGWWKEKYLHHFGNGGDGSYVYSNLAFDSAGNLYGATFFGGKYAGGTAFELVPQSDGTWIKKTLHSFGNSNDGNGPLSDVTFDASGNLYGTTVGGGANQEGTVWRVSF